VRRNFLFLGCIVFLGACAGISSETRRDTADRLALAGGFTYSEVQTDRFKLAGYRGNQAPGVVTIYIEGDGFSFVTQNRISTDPTPINPIGLRLAIMDGEKNVVYLARPCQYVDLAKEAFCASRYWSSHRFSEEVILAYEQVLEEMKRVAGATAFHLVGYSGGGAVAVLVAARRGDIMSVRTVAAYLDHVALNQLVGVAPLRGSLDPMKIAAELNRIPQIHYAGDDDHVIPPWVAEKFVSSVGASDCAHAVVLNGVGHEKGWAMQWKNLAPIKPAC